MQIEFYKQKISGILNQSFVLLDKKRYRWILVILCVFFSIIFVNVFVPFNINHWNNDSGLDQFIRLSGFGFIFGVVLILSQLYIRNIAGVVHFRIITFILWFPGEVFFLSFFFMCYQIGGEINNEHILKNISDSLKYTLPGIIIPYSFSLLFIFLIIHKKELNQLKETSSKQTINSELLYFPDEKGEIRFSITENKIFYIETADNYVIIHYMNENKIKKQILRNSMKNMELLFTQSVLKRCHRSFMINIKKIEFVDYRKNKCQIKLSEIAGFIPVSRKFYPNFKSFIVYFPK